MTTWWTRRESEPQTISGIFPVKRFTLASANRKIWRNWWETCWEIQYWRFTNKSVKDKHRDVTLLVTKCWIIYSLYTYIIDFSCISLVICPRKKSSISLLDPSRFVPRILLDVIQHLSTLFIFFSYIYVYILLFIYIYINFWILHHWSCHIPDFGGFVFLWFLLWLVSTRDFTNVKEIWMKFSRI